MTRRGDVYPWSVRRSGLEVSESVSVNAENVIESGWSWSGVAWHGPVSGAVR